MKTKIIQSIPALLTLMALGFVHFSQWCTDVGQICYRTTLDQMFPYVITPLYFFSLYSLPLALILIFVPRNIFISWLKFAAWMLPLLFIFVATQPVVSGFLSTNRDDAARLAGQVFSVISLILIIWKYFATRRSQS